MNQISLDAWQTALTLRDTTYLNLFIIAAAGLSTWRMWLPDRLSRPLATALAAAFIALLTLGVVELCRL
jgi:hypothetical protein